MVYSVPVNVTNPVELLVGVSNQVPFLFKGILILVFLVILSSSYYAQQRRIGKGNISQSIVIASLITNTLAFILYLINGLITLADVIIATSITLITGLWFLFSREDSSV